MNLNNEDIMNKDFIKLTKISNVPIYINKDNIIDMYSYNDNTYIDCISNFIIVQETLDEVLAKL